MTTDGMMTHRRRMLGLSGLLILLASSSVAVAAPSWRIERGDVHILVPLKPGGAFGATTPSLSGTLTLEQPKPARLMGEISMDLATIDTGISLRNQHLREKYLEVGKGKGFDRAVLSAIHLKTRTTRRSRVAPLSPPCFYSMVCCTQWTGPQRSGVTVWVGACARSFRCFSRTSG